jgi:hypothetical protein
VNRIDDVRTGLGCDCVVVGFENPAAIRKLLFQSSTSRALMLKVKGEIQSGGSSHQGDTKIWWGEGRRD